MEKSKKKIISIFLFLTMLLSIFIGFVINNTKASADGAVTEYDFSINDLTFINFDYRYNYNINGSSVSNYDKYVFRFKAPSDIQFYMCFYPISITTGICIEYKQESTTKQTINVSYVGSTMITSLYFDNIGFENNLFQISIQGTRLGIYLNNQSSFIYLDSHSSNLSFNGISKITMKNDAGTFNVNNLENVTVQQYNSLLTDIINNNSYTALEHDIHKLNIENNNSSIFSKYKVYIIGCFGIFVIILSISFLSRLFRKNKRYK